MTAFTEISRLCSIFNLFYLILTREVTSLQINDTILVVFEAGQVQPTCQFGRPDGEPVSTRRSAPCM